MNELNCKMEQRRTIFCLKDLSCFSLTSSLATKSLATLKSIIQIDFWRKETDLALTLVSEVEGTIIFHERMKLKTSMCWNEVRNAIYQSDGRYFVQKL